MTPTNNISDSNGENPSISALHIWDQELLFPGQADPSAPLPDESEGEPFETYEEDHSVLGLFAAQIDGMEWSDGSAEGESQDLNATQIQWCDQYLLPLWCEVVGSDGVIAINESIQIRPKVWMDGGGGRKFAHFGKTIAGVKHFAVSKSPQNRRFVLQVDFNAGD